MSAGEDRLASALEQALKPPWATYRNVAWLEKRPGDEPADGEADIVIAHPELGIMVIEVKGGRVGRIRGRWESVDRNDNPHQIKNPFAQVMREMHGLRRVCEAMPAWPAHRVRLARAVCLPDSAYDRSMTPDGPREIVIDHDDLATAGERVREIFDWWSRSGDASADGGAPGAIGMAALHELLARDLEIESPLAARVAGDEAQIVTLSERQFQVLDMLAGHRRAVILGVAGSGKTLIAAEKARRLAAQGFDVLLTCFNRPLAEHLEATIGRLDRVTVSTFHRLAERLGTDAGLIGAHPAHDAAYFDGLPDVLDRALRARGEPRFDAIVVDEGQDLDAVWWLPLLDLLRGRVPASEVVVLTPRSHRSSWLMGADPSAPPVEAWPYRLMPEYGPEGAVLPPPTKGGQVRVATIHRYKGLESPVVVLCELDARIPDGELASLLYVGASRARSHLVVVCSEELRRRVAGA